MDKETQCNVILQYMQKVGPITAKIARNLCGCERLAARIHNLCARGIPIKTEFKTYINEHGHLTRYGIYRLEEDNA